MKKPNRQRDMLLQRKRTKHNQSRKGKQYNPNKKYFVVQNGQVVPQKPGIPGAHRAETEVLDLS